MNFRSSFGVIFATFFNSAFSNKGCCCKVRHARILWFLQWILTIFKFHIFLENGKNHRISSRISMQKKSEIQCRISLKIRCKKTWKFMKNPWKLTPESRPSKKEAQNWDFWWIWAPSWGPKWVKIGPKSDLKCYHFCHRFEDRFLKRFGANLTPSWTPKPSQNGAKLALKST